jgi:hypothetical protein
VDTARRDGDVSRAWAAAEGKITTLVDSPGAGTEDAAEESSGGGWIQMWDEEVLSNYYYNSITGEASWIRPEDYRGADDNDGAMTANNSGAKERAAGGGEDVEWERYWDETEGAFYMHNPSSGETRWADDGVDGATAEPK